MKRRTSILFLITALVVLSLAAAVQAAPQAFSISWWTVDGGGGSSGDGTYSLSGTIGQPDAQILQGGGYVLAGGFWGSPSAKGGYDIFLPVAIR